MRLFVSKSLLSIICIVLCIIVPLYGGYTYKHLSTPYVSESIGIEMAVERFKDVLENELREGFERYELIINTNQHWGHLLNEYVKPTNNTTLSIYNLDFHSTLGKILWNFVMAAVQFLASLVEFVYVTKTWRIQNNYIIVNHLSFPSTAYFAVVPRGVDTVDGVTPHCVFSHTWYGPNDDNEHLQAEVVKTVAMESCSIRRYWSPMGFTNWHMQAIPIAAQNPLIQDMILQNDTDISTHRDTTNSTHLATIPSDHKNRIVYKQYLFDYRTAAIGISNDFRSGMTVVLNPHQTNKTIFVSSKFRFPLTDGSVSIYRPRWQATMANSYFTSLGHSFNLPLPTFYQNDYITINHFKSNTTVYFAITPDSNHDDNNPVYCIFEHKWIQPLNSTNKKPSQISLLGNDHELHARVISQQGMKCKIKRTIPLLSNFQYKIIAHMSKNTHVTHWEYN